MTAPITDLSTRLREQQRISAEDALKMRRIVWQDGAIDPAEADAIFDLNSAVSSTCRDWVDFFVEAMAVYLVRQQAPQGYVDEAKAGWLIAKIDHDGQVDTLGELELLVKVLEEATSVPDSLRNYALTQIEKIVATGVGPTRDGGTVSRACITDTEVGLLRRVLYAQAGDGPAIVSRSEAEMLFRLKDTTLGKPHSPAWQKLFVQAVGNHLMAHHRYTPLAREGAARLDAVMADTAPDTAGFLTRMVSGLFNGTPVPSTAHRPARDTAIAADRAITPHEQDWLARLIDRDGQRDPMEDALLAFIATESGASPSS
jgi:hypothetical protein